MGTEERSSSAEASSKVEATPINVFISYRREDASANAGRLRDNLAERFGVEHVFIDVADLRSGENFPNAIRERVKGCNVLLALIGKHWLSSLRERAKAHTLDQVEDYVKVELQTALKDRFGTRVLPVLLDDATMPTVKSLPKSLHRLPQLDAAKLRHESWHDDVGMLIKRIEDIAAAPEYGNVNGGVGNDEPLEPPSDPTAYSDVARHIAQGNEVIPFLGSLVNSCDRTDEAVKDDASSRDWDELAVHLAQKFGYEPAPVDLAEVSQRVLLTEGKGPLYKELRQILKASPSPVHRFLAALPAMLEARGSENCYQLIVTTNYDEALETAFDEAQEDYDLAVYMAHGEHKGKFLHVPFDGDPQPIMVTNGYIDFPIHEDGRLERTIILKVHGAVENVDERWRENYVITENDYIDYMSQTKIESVVPLQLLTKMKESHFLFLGYRVRDWNLRVFLQRVWGEQRLGARSWAIDSHAGDVEKRFWHHFDVDLLDVPLSAYLEGLRQELVAQERASAEP